MKSLKAHLLVKQKQKRSLFLKPWCHQVVLRIGTALQALTQCMRESWQQQYEVPEAEITIPLMFASVFAGDRVPRARAAELSLQLANAVKQLHAVQILHLNIRPENVLLDQHGSIVLCDFGRARQVQAGLLDVPVPAVIVASFTDCYMYALSLRLVYMHSHIVMLQGSHFLPFQ